MEGTKKEVTYYANAAGGLGNMKMELGEHEPLKVTGNLNKSHSDALVWAEAKGQERATGDYKHACIGLSRRPWALYS